MIILLKIKCFFGLHKLIEDKNIEISNCAGFWRKAKYCKHCKRGGDTA